MSTRRAPSAPPDLPGFTFVSLLGSGGFADVFLYDQHRPRRKVAVKVLLATMLSPSVLRQFDAEADLMAQLSTHPSIVTIYEVGVAADGRPFLVMQYCPRPSLGLRFRREPSGVADALRIGVEVAGAVETAHRAGILHRDIKPANILVTEYNEPLLTDFGIASTVGTTEDHAEGMSIPWSPPESFAEPPQAGVATDVWALGATVYTLLAGRSPFELPGRSNGSVDLIARIEAARLVPTGRADVPQSLERVLATAMGRTPESRYPSALAFARALQQVQQELGLGATAVSILDDVVVAEPDDDEDDAGTRIRRVVAIDPTGSIAATAPGRKPAPPVPASVQHRPYPDATGPQTPRAPVAPVEDTRGAPASAPQGPWRRPPDAPAVDETVHRPAPAVQEASEQDAPVRSRRGLLIGAALAAAVVATVAVVALNGSPDGSPGEAGPAATSAPQDVVPGVVGTPTGLTGVVDGATVTFTWVGPDPQPGDAFLWRVLDVLGEESLARTEEPTVTVPVQAGGQTCLEVFLTRDGQASNEPAQACAP